MFSFSGDIKKRCKRVRVHRMHGLIEEYEYVASMIELLYSGTHRKMNRNTKTRFRMAMATHEVLKRLVPNISPYKTPTAK